MFVKPGDGLQVRDPVTKALLPAEGKEVPETIYWTRRVNSGDVVRVVQEAESVLETNQITPDHFGEE